MPCFDSRRRRLAPALASCALTSASVSEVTAGIMDTISHKAARIEPAGPVRLELVLAFIVVHGLVVVDVSDLAEEAFDAILAWIQEVDPDPRTHRGVGSGCSH